MGVVAVAGGGSLRYSLLDVSEIGGVESDVERGERLRRPVAPASTDERDDVLALSRRHMPGPLRAFVDFLKRQPRS